MPTQPISSRTRLPLSRRRPSSALVTRSIAGSAGPILSRMSVWLCSESAALGTSQCNTRRPQVSRPSQFRILPIKLGADEVVRDGKSLAAAGGADVILSTSNSTKSMVDSIQGLRPDGRLVAMGADVEPLSISLMDLIVKRIRVIGSQQNGLEYLYEALDFVAQGKVKTIVETYPLAEASKAYERVAQGKARFRVVLT